MNGTIIKNFTAHQIDGGHDTAPALDAFGLPQALADAQPCSDGALGRMGCYETVS